MKRSVMFDGMDCLSTSAAMTAAGSVSQKQVAWMDQAAYAKVTVYFGVVIIFVALLKYLWTLYRDFSYRRNQKGLGFGSNFINVLIAYSRYVGYKQLPLHMTYYTSLPQSFGSVLFMFVSSLYLYMYTFVPHFWLRGCAAFGSPPLAVRAGVMATALTPFIYVLAGKSNMITLLTGFSYEKLNVYHQYVGVTALVLSLIHTIPFIYQAMLEGGQSNLALNFKDFAYYSGIPPLVLLIILCAGSKAIVRKYIYETFYHLHWMCGVAYIGTLIWHINKSFNCDDYMWGAVAFWGSQLIYRILVKTAFKPNRMFLRPRVAFLRKLNERAFEVVVENTVGYKWQPGQHAFLRFAGSRVLDNHPFSICTTIESINETDPQAPMKFIIIPKRGLTGKLYDLISTDLIEKKVYLDGAYGGSPRDHTAFDRVILIASGSGVSATLPFLIALSQNIAKAKAADKPIITKGVNFIWIVRHADNVNWIKQELIRCQELAGEYIKIDIFISRDDVPVLEQEEKKSDIESQEVGASYNLYNFRPDVSVLLAKLQTTFGRRNMIVSSGSDSMKVEISNKVSELQSLVFNGDIRGGHVEEVYLHTESFGW